MFGRSVHSWLTCGSRKLMLLAPESITKPNNFGAAESDPKLYDRLLANMQRLRGSTYLEDGAVSPDDLTADGRHISPADAQAWHVLSVDPCGSVRGCARYLSHGNRVSFSDLVIRNSALAEHPLWGARLREAVEDDVAIARRRRVSYVEVGGWALHKTARCTREALRIALATYALSRNLGGCIGISTVTVRHCSAAILQKIGGRFLEFAGSPLPLYYDPQYRCDMAMLRFDSNETNPRYESCMEELRVQFSAVPVLYKPLIHEPAPGAWQFAPEGMLACA